VPPGVSNFLGGSIGFQVFAPNTVDAHGYWTYTGPALNCQWQCDTLVFVPGTLCSMNVDVDGIFVLSWDNFGGVGVFPFSIPLSAGALVHIHMVNNPNLIGQVGGLFSILP